MNWKFNYFIFVYKTRYIWYRFMCLFLVQVYVVPHLLIIYVYAYIFLFGYYFNVCKSTLRVINKIQFNQKGQNQLLSF